MIGASSRTTIIVLSVCLLISVCLNLFVGGALVAGRWLDQRLEASASRVMQSYPPAVRQAVMRQLRADRGAMLMAVRDLRDARRTMFAVMRSEPLDRAALDQAMMDVRGRTEALQALLQSALAESLASTPASERQKIAAPGLGQGLLDGANP